MRNQDSFSERSGGPAHRNGANGEAWGSAHDGGGTSEASEISVQDVVELLFRNKWLILACFLAVLVATSVYTAQQDPRYQAASKVYLERQSPSMGGLGKQMLNLPLFGSNGNVANEVEILRSRSIARRVAERVMNQRYVPGTDRTLTVLKTGASEEPLTRRQVVDRLRRDEDFYVQVSPVSREVNMIEITGQSTIPEEASFLANAYAEEYVEYDRDRSRDRAQKSHRFLKEAVGTFQDTLRSQENQLQSFLTNQEVVAPEAEAKAIISQLRSLRQQRYQAEIRRGQAQVRIRELEAKLEKISPQLAEKVMREDALLSTSYKRRIADLRRQLEEIYAVSPEVRQNPQQHEEAAKKIKKIESLKEELSGHVDRMVRDAYAGTGTGTGGHLSQVQNLTSKIFENQLEVQAGEAAIDVLDGAIATYRRQMKALPRQEMIFNRMQRSLQTSSKVYATLLARLYNARVAEESGSGSVEVLDEAVVPRGATWPKIELSVSAAAVLGLLLGVGLAFLRTLFDSRVRTPEDLRRRGHRLLGTVPDMQHAIDADFDGRERVSTNGASNGRLYSTRLMTLLDPLSPVAESYRQLSSNLLQLRRSGHAARVLMVTSAGADEGKSVTALNLVLAMAQAGQRTLYVDADLRRPTGHWMLDQSHEPGLTDLLSTSQADDYREAPFSTEIDNFYFMPVGGRSEVEAAWAMTSEKMGRLVEKLRGAFDTVVIDAPPALAVGGSLPMASHCDAAVIVCRADQTHGPALERSVEALRQAGGRVAGVVLNGFDPGAVSGAYGNYAYYSDYRPDIEYREEPAVRASHE